VPGDGTFQYFPVAQHYLAMTVNQEFEPQLRLLWSGPDGQLALLHQQPAEEGCVRLTALRPPLAKVLANMIHTQARIFVAVSKTFSQHEMHFTDSVPEDGQYLEVTHLRAPDSVSSVRVGVHLKVPASATKTVRAALAAVPLPAGTSLEITEKR